MQHVNFIDSAGDEDPERTRKRLLKREQAPSTRQQAYSYQYYHESLTSLGNPYDVTRIPISTLQQMQRDPMIAFGMHFIKLPIIRSNWYIECERADIAAFIDNSLRRIMATYVNQRFQALNFGFVPIIKRFQEEMPSWKYYDPATSDVLQPVWDNGPIKAITWKPFVVLPSDPAKVQPRFLETTGEFNGISYQGGANLVPFGAIRNSDKGQDVDIQHSLWLSNEKESVQNSLWGFPRAGYAYRYWWSYWFRWALYDRFFERKADPPMYVYYPTGGSGDYTEDEDGEVSSMKEIALGIGEQARAGGVLAMPGDTHSGYDDRPTTTREWEVGEIEVKGDVENFQASFEYLDVMKLRAIWVAEQALIEGKGGTSSRNVAKEEISLHKEGAGAIADEIDDEINRWVIPDLVTANFPEFKGDCLKKTTGFTDADRQTMQQVLQWVGQSDASALRGLDIKAVLERAGMPTISPDEIRRQEKEAEKALVESQPPVINPQAGENAGVNEQGFYVQARDRITLAENTKFLTSLPKSKHFQDKKIISEASDLKSVWKAAYKEIYEDFAKFISRTSLEDTEFIDWLNLDAKLVPNKPGVKNWVERKGGLPKKIADMAGDLISERGFSTAHAIATAVNQARKLCAKGNAVWCEAVAQWEKMKMSASNEDELHLADDDLIKRAIEQWNFSRNKLDNILNESENSVKNVISRAGELELRRAKLSPEWQVDNDMIADYLNERGTEFIKAIDETVREELKTFLANMVKENVPQEEIANRIREHFADFPEWKADRLVRSEIRNAYNFATLIAGEQAGVKIAQARDAQLGDTDPECMERNGKFFTIEDALAESTREHPNGTLEWILTNRENLSIEYVTDMPDKSESLAYFDDKNSIIYLRNDIPKDIEQKYLLQLGDSFTS